MLCFKLSKRNFLKLTFSLLTAFIILLGGIDHADASFNASSTLYVSGATTTVSFLNGSYIYKGSSYNSYPIFFNSSSATSTGAIYYTGGTFNGSRLYTIGLNVGDSGNPVYDWQVLNEPYGYAYDYNGWGSILISSSSPVVIYGCMDNMAVNYDPTATVESGGCYYVLPDEVATSTRIISFSFSTTTNTLDLSYYIATSTPVSLYAENRNERDGVINSAFSTTTTGLTELKNIPVTLPNPLNGAGYTYLTAKLVLASDHGVIYDWHTLTIDLYNGIDLGGGGYQQEECGITHLGGCFMNGLAVMFYPSQSAFNNFNTFVELIKTKPPVGYFYVVKNNLDNLNSTTTSAFNVTIPAHIKDYLFTPFDVGIGGILWFFFAMNFYKRLKHITV